MQSVNIGVSSASPARILGALGGEHLFFEQDFEGVLTHVSDSALPLIGYRPEELTWTQPGGYPADHPLAALEQCRADVFASGRPRTRECLIRHGNGRMRILEVYVAPVADERETAMFVGLARDITARKASEHGLVRSEVRYRRLFERLQDEYFFFTLDTEGCFTNVDNSVERILSLIPGDLSGRTFVSQVTTSSLNGQVDRNISEALAGGIAEPFQCEIKTPGGPKVIEVLNLPVFDHGAKVVGIEGIARDITARRSVDVALEHARDRLEERIAERTAELEAANADLRHEIRDRRLAEARNRALTEQLHQSQKMEAVGRLAGGIAHDFNNLLTVIMGYGAMLEEGLEGDERFSREIEELMDAATSAAEVTNQLLALSRSQPCKPQTIDVNEFVSELSRMLVRLIGEDIRLELLSDLSVGGIRADRGQLSQVILNLAVNARDAMPQGGKLTISTREVRLRVAAGSLTPGRYISIQVKDNGQGMDEETRRHAFEPFFTTKTESKGTGLGLATAYGIVQQFGGDMRIESEPGVGSTFEVLLPHCDSAVDASVEDAEAALALSRATVLVVEDEPVIRKLAREALKDGGYHVLEAGDGVEALEVAADFEGEIELLLSDIVMPRMNGPKLAARLGKVRPDMRIVFTSGYPDVKGGLELPDDPRVSFIKKPFTMRTLRDHVVKVLDAT